MCNHFYHVIGFPSKDVIEAYLNPMVDESDEPFSWSMPDLDGLREFTKRKFGWNQARADEILLPVMKNLSLRTVSYYCIFSSCS